MRWNDGAVVQGRLMSYRPHAAGSEDEREISIKRTQERKVSIMTELNLSVSDKFNERDIQTIRIALGNYLKVGNPSRVFQRSADPPSIIELLGAVALWAPLTIAATTYLIR